MRFLKKCENKECQQEFNVLKDVNLIRDADDSLKAICPWCDYKNNLTIKEKNSLLLASL